MGEDTFKEKYNSAITLYKKGDYDTSLRIIDEAISLNPNNFQAYFAKGMILKKIGRLEDASENYSLSIKYCDELNFLEKIKEKKVEIEKLINKSEFSDLLLLDEEESSHSPIPNGLDVDDVQMEIQRQLDSEEYFDAITNLDRIIIHLKGEENFDDTSLKDLYIARSYSYLKTNQFTNAKEDVLKVFAVDPSNEVAIAINDEITSKLGQSRIIKPISKPKKEKSKILSNNQSNDIAEKSIKKITKKKRFSSIFGANSSQNNSIDYSVTSFVYIFLGLYIYSIIVFKINPFSIIALFFLFIIFLTIELSSKPLLKEKHGYLLIFISFIGLAFQATDMQRRIAGGESAYTLSIIPPPPSVVDYLLGVMIVAIIAHYLWENLKGDINKDYFSYTSSLSRIKSVFVDGVVIFILLLLTVIILNMILKIPTEIASVVAIVEIIAVSLLLELSPRHATIGKMKVHSKILNNDGTPASNIKIIKILRRLAQSVH